MSQSKPIILLVTDCQEDRETYRRYLQQQQQTYTILEADSGKQALSICADRFPDAILLNDTLPDLNVSAIVNQLEAYRGTDNIPVVVVSEHNQEEIATITNGAADYLIKSEIHAETLRLSIKHAIERDRLLRQRESDIMARQQVEEALQQQLMRQRLLVDMLERIRQSLNLDEILHTTASEVRQFLETDRVIIFRFEQDWSGRVMVESVNSPWTAILSTTLNDPCFSKPQKGSPYIERYQQGRVMAITDIHTAGLTPCHVELLDQLQVRANLIVPILQGQYLWGLLIAHHCAAPRQWRSEDIELLQHLAIQVGIAIQQSTLYAQLENELCERTHIEEELRQARDFLEKRVLERTNELEIINQDLEVTLEELRVVQEELRQQNDALFTAREMAESERQRYQDLFSEAPDGYLVTDIMGTIREANRAAAALLQIDQNRLVGKPLALFIAEADRKTFRFLLTKLQPPDREINLKPRLGSFFPAVLTMTCIYNAQGQPSGLRWLIRDISAAKRNEAERKQAEQKIEEQAALIDISTDAIFVRDLKNRIFFWSQGAARLYGWKTEEVLGKKAHDLFSKESSSQHEPDLNTVIEKNTWYGELEQVTKDGQKIIVESRWTLVRDEAGRPQSILVVNTDITEKKHLEIQFYRAQRLESLGTLASGIAHDLNNILQPILFITPLLKQKFPHLDVQTQERLKMLEDSSKRGASLVEQILSFACGDDGKRIHVQVKHLLREVVQVAQKTFSKAIKIRLNLPIQDLWTVYADATQLHQVFMNLIVNARDAMPDGGTLTLEAENLFINETDARMELEAHPGHYLAISITDTGMGISPEIIERIFDPFFTTKSPGKGTGLGLFTVIGIVKAHNGFVRVSSAIGRGSQFMVYLPATDGGEETQPTQDLELPNGHGELILVVDDEIFIREMTQTSLLEHNYRAIMAKNGYEALALYEEYNDDISIVLMDLMMPEMDGVSAIRTLQELNPQLKIIVTSGLGSRSKLNKAVDLGITTFLSKPFTEQELLNMLYNLLGGEGMRG